MKGYIYLVLLLFMLLILFQGFAQNVKHAPTKIRMVCVGVYSAMFLRYITLFIFLLVKNIKYLYLFKPIYFLNLICVPIVGMISIYIFMRNDKLKFSFIFCMIGVLIVAYGYVCFKYPIILGIDKLCGYYMEFKDFPYIYICYMLISTFIIIFSSDIYSKNSFKKGFIFIILSSVFVIVESATNVLDKMLFNQIIISDIFWVLTLNYGLRKLKKTSR